MHSVLWSLWPAQWFRPRSPREGSRTRRRVVDGLFLYTPPTAYWGIVVLADVDTYGEFIWRAHCVSVVEIRSHRISLPSADLQLSSRPDVVCMVNCFRSVLLTICEGLYDTTSSQRNGAQLEAISFFLECVVHIRAVQH